MELSIVMCNHNFGHYISCALEGMALQTTPPLEFLLIDDASTDDSISIIESYKEKIPWMTLLKNPKRLGAYKSADEALRYAKGKYIYFACSDDLILPNFVECSLSFFQTYPHAGFICSEGSYFCKEDEIKNPILASPPLHQFYSPTQIQNFKKRKKTFLGHTSIYNRKYVIEAGGVQEKDGPLCDWFFSHVIALRYGFVFVEAILAHKRIHEANLSHERHSRKAYCSYILQKIETKTYQDIRKSFLNYRILQELRKEFLIELLLQKKIGKTFFILSIKAILSKVKKFTFSVFKKIRLKIKHSPLQKSEDPFYQ